MQHAFTSNKDFHHLFLTQLLRSVCGNFILFNVIICHLLIVIHLKKSSQPSTYIDLITDKTSVK